MPATSDLLVAVIGAGLIGLAAATHLIERGLRPLIFEARTTAGAAVSDWGHIRLQQFRWAFPPELFMAGLPTLTTEREQRLDLVLPAGLA